jgi:hypothetical protein
MEYVKDQGCWCGEGYLLKTNSADKGIPLSAVMGSTVQPQHLIDDLFLLTCIESWLIRDNYFMIYSLSQQRVIWSKNNISSYLMIPEEKAILTYNLDGTVQLLSMYTGNILSSFNFQGCIHIIHIIGPLCYFIGTKMVFINVRTGEIVCTLKLDPVLQSLTNPARPDMEPANILSTRFLDHTESEFRNVLGPTHVSYVSTKDSRGLSFEYAQI